MDAVGCILSFKIFFFCCVEIRFFEEKKQLWKRILKVGFGITMPPALVIFFFPLFVLPFIKKINRAWVFGMGDGWEQFRQTKEKKPLSKVNYHIHGQKGHLLTPLSLSLSLSQSPSFLPLSPWTHQRRYERLAATSQLSLWYFFCHLRLHPLNRSEEGSLGHAFTPRIGTEDHVSSKLFLPLCST